MTTAIRFPLIIRRVPLPGFKGKPGPAHQQEHVFSQEHLAYCPALILLALGKSLREICIPELTTDYRRRHSQAGSCQNLNPVEAAAANASLRSTGLWFACQ